MTCMALTNPFFKLIANVMEEEAAKYGYELVALDGANDGAAQNAQISDFVAQGYDAIFLNRGFKSSGRGRSKSLRRRNTCIHIRYSDRRRRSEANGDLAYWQRQLSRRSASG